MTVTYGSTKNGNSSTYTWRAFITYTFTSTYSETASRFQFQNIGVDRVKTSGQWNNVYFTNRSCTAGGTSMVNMTTQVTLSWASGNGDNKVLTSTTKNVDFTRTCAATTKAVSFSVKHKESGNTSTGSFNVTVPARTLYTVTFDGNNGTVTSGAKVTCANCSGNHKSYGYAATIDAAATRTGYTFTGWNTAADGSGTSYGNGGQIAAGTNANLTLYAQWSENTATLTYNANGHGTAPAPVTMKYTTSTDAAAALTAMGYTFIKWNTASDDSGTSYSPGAQIKAANVIPSATTLYAIWRPNNYVKVNGTWKEVTVVYVKIEGVWKPGTILPIPDN